MSEQERQLIYSEAGSRVAIATPTVLQDLAYDAGIEFNGSAPWDIQIHDNEVYQRILTKGSLGFGEAYVDGLWDAFALDELFYRLLRADLGKKLTGRAKLRLGLEALRHSLFNLQTCARAFQVAQEHYDIGNDVFSAMLDSSMSYSCGFWENADNLEQAQHQKLDLICRKLNLQAGERLLDIGCGWGGLAKYAAQNYNVEVVGVTVSQQQQELARQHCSGLPIHIELMDYRALTGEYDKVVSVGMFEHVGPKNYPVYFESVRRLLKEEGIFLLHSIGSDKFFPAADPWINRYVFPNGKLPSARELTEAVEGHFLIEDWHNFGQDYDRTLMAWWHNFHCAWPRLKDNYDERFYRMWKYYLMCCAGYFRARRGQLWQLVLVKPERETVYRSTRTVSPGTLH